MGVEGKLPTCGAVVGVWGLEGGMVMGAVLTVARGSRCDRVGGGGVLAGGGQLGA